MERLSAGLCDNCVYCIVMYEGNGTDKPIQRIPYCPKENNEIIPAPDSHKEMRVSECQYYVRNKD